MLALRAHSYTGWLESRDCSQPVSEVAAARVDSSTAVRKPPVMTAADCCASDPARVTIQKTVCIFEATGADRRPVPCPATNIDPYITGSISDLNRREELPMSANGKTATGGIVPAYYYGWSAHVWIDRLHRRNSSLPTAVPGHHQPALLPSVWGETDSPT